MNTYSMTTYVPQNCTNCHTGSGIPDAPIVSEHNQFGQDVITSVNCTLCHSNSGMYLSNNGTNGTTTAIVHYLKDVTNLGTSPVGHNGTINTSNCIDCHNGPYTGVSSWGAPVNISTSTKRTHIETQTGQCDLCHKDGTVQSLALVDFHNASIKLASTNDCISCHTQDQRGYPAINLTLFTRHSNVNTTGGQNNLTNDDSPPAITTSTTLK
ncbi:MAG: hypothetical protein PHH85_05250 [Candidatus Methanoperedens sp.]|nr:hypothetical protein [Candidatus Methanoperedens sp.]